MPTPSRRKVVFAWWGAEEIGLLGSRHFVRSYVAARASPEPWQYTIAANLNFDMLGSPNYIRQVGGVRVGGSLPVLVCCGAGTDR